MGRMILDLDLDKCCACGACAIACMDQNDIDTAMEMPLRTVFTAEDEDKGTIAYMSLACMHCADAPCVMACPIGCFTKDETTGLIVCDNASCIGCHSCALACPYGALSYTTDGKAQKCDGCAVRVQHGLEPACVRICALNALSLYDEQDQRAAKLTRSVQKIIELL